jgi:hypothetical protein
MPIAQGSSRRSLLSGALLALIVVRPSAPAPAFATSRLPSVMLWAWERPSDLRAIPADAGVAFLSQTITIDANRVGIAFRRWPLKVMPSTPLSAVTRIEMPVTRALTDDEVTRMANAIAATARFPGVAAVQIDFDATQSQRDLYRRLIEDARRRIDAGVPLSITALASWCVGDRWLDGLPVDEAVPMLFQLGPFNEPYREVARDPAAAHRLCRTSLGTSLDEPLRLAPAGRRIYIFNPQAWTPEGIDRAYDYARGERGVQ